MTPRIVFGMCVLAALGGVVTAGILTAAPHTASASVPEPAMSECCDPKPVADIMCWIHIKDSHVEASNLCSPYAKASSDDKIEVRDGKHGHDGKDGRDGKDGHGGSDGTECEAEGLVNVQTCDIVLLKDIKVGDVLSDNDVLSENKVILEDVLNHNDLDIVEDLVEDNTIVGTVTAPVAAVIDLL